MTQEGTRRPSLLSQHLALLGLQDDGSPTDLAASVHVERERERLAELTLPPLTLGRGANAKPGLYERLRQIFAELWVVPSVRILTASAAVLIAALVPRLVWTDPGAGDRLRVKGDSKVWVYWERDGEVLPWTRDVELRSGDRVRAEVLAGVDGVAYLAVVNGEGRLLSEPRRVKEGALQIKAGERQIFPGSIKLVGENEGETLVVLMCERGPAGQVPDLSPVLSGRGLKLQVAELPKTCGVEEFALRGGRPSKP